MGFKRKKSYGRIIFLFFVICLTTYSMNVNETSLVVINNKFEKNNLQESFFEKNKEDVLKYFKDNQVSKSSLLINGFFSSLGIFVLNVFFIWNQSSKSKKEKEFEKRSAWYKSLIVDPYLEKIRLYFNNLNGYCNQVDIDYINMMENISTTEGIWKHLYSDLKMFNESLATQVQTSILDSEDNLIKLCFQEITSSQYGAIIENNERNIIKLLYEFDFNWSKKKKEKN